MKTNNRHNWKIVLLGRPNGDYCQAVLVFPFVGKIDEALAEADELESEAEFDVVQITVTRRR